MLKHGETKNEEETCDHKFELAGSFHINVPALTCGCNVTRGTNEQTGTASGGTRRGTSREGLHVARAPVRFSA